MNPLLQRRVILLILIPLLLAFLLWQSFHQQEFSVVNLLPPLLIIIAGAAAFFSKGKRRVEPSRPARIVAGLVAVAIGLVGVLWDRHASAHEASAGTSIAHWVVLALILLLAAGMLLWRLTQRGRDQQAR